MTMEVSDFVYRILTALVLGVVIGIERQAGQHPAGVRTNALVCLGSALFVSLSQVFGDKDSTSRIAAQVVSGIGFLGGGAILREGVTVRGMNTAATLWCSAAIGALVGAGALLFALLGTISVLLSHLLFRPIAHAIDKFTQGKGETDIVYEMKVDCERSREPAIRVLLIEQFKTAGLRLQGVSLLDGGAADRVRMEIHLFSCKRNDQTMSDVISLLTGQPGVGNVSWGKAH